MVNISDNPRIQIKSLSYTDIKNIFFSEAGAPDKLYRPISCLSFAINALIGGTDPEGYHITNLLLHILTFLFLWQLLGLVFATPKLRSSAAEEKSTVIAFAALLWAINPIQTQAVTYIVQRMAMLSCLFSILSLICYLRARMSVCSRNRAFLIFASFFSFLLSIMSKENGLITPLLIICVEIILFETDLFRIINKNKVTISLFIVSIFIVILSLILLNPLKYLNYEERTFTLLERVLTQPRVLILYLTQLFYPEPGRLSIEHDIILSTGIFTPVSTFFSISAITLLIMSAFFLKKLHPIYRLAIFFFLFGHIIESSIVPLEMIFEHRNYFPSILIFAPVVLYIYRLYANYHQNRVIRTLIITSVTSIIFLFSIWTYSRNNTWADETSLWTDAFKKAPNAARPKHILGLILESSQDYESALFMYKMALDNFFHHKKYRAETLLNIGNIYSINGNYADAHLFWDKALKVDDNLAKIYLAKTEGYIKEKKWETARHFINAYKHKSPDNFFINKFESITNMHTGNFKEAILNINKCLHKKPNEVFSLIRLAECLSLSGFYERADFFLKICSIEHPNESAIYLAMAKNYYLNNMEDMARQRIQDYFRITGADNVNDDLKRISKTYELPMIGLDKMTDFIIKNFETYKTGMLLSKENITVK